VPAGAERNRAGNAISADFGGLIELIGYKITQSEENLVVTLVWRAIEAPALDYTAFVHLVDNDGSLIAQTDRSPAGYPTSDWRPGEVVIDRFQIDFPPGMSAGNHRLLTGFYDPSTIDRLGEAVPIGEVVIQ
jgi:hypothetical protein